MNSFGSSELETIARGILKKKICMERCRFAYKFDLNSDYFSDKILQNKQYKNKWKKK